MFSTWQTISQAEPLASDNEFSTKLIGDAFSQQPDDPHPEMMDIKKLILSESTNIDNIPAVATEERITLDVCIRGQSITAKIQSAIFDLGIRDYLHVDCLMRKLAQSRSMFPDLRFEVKQTEWQLANICMNVLSTACINSASYRGQAQFARNRLTVATYTSSPIEINNRKVQLIEWKYCNGTFYLILKTEGKTRDEEIKTWIGEWQAVKKLEDVTLSSLAEEAKLMDKMLDDIKKLDPQSPLSHCTESLTVTMSDSEVAFRDKAQPQEQRRLREESTGKKRTCRDAATALRNTGDLTEAEKYCAWDTDDDWS